MNTFDDVLQQIPLDWRCYQTDTGKFQNYPLNFCFFGIPGDPLYGRVPLAQMPLTPPGVAFLAGAEQTTLLDAFVRSPYAQTIHTLVIGSSSYTYGKGFDYTDTIAPLYTAYLPQLTTLQLGVWELFCNAHCAYGRMGNITDALTSLASVKALGLYGQFELSRPLTLPQLQRLTVESNDPITGINGGPLTNNTVHHLLESDMPNLEHATLIFLQCNAEQSPCYTFPDTFLHGAKVPRLHSFEMDADVLAAGEGERLRASALGHRAGMRIYLNDE